MIIYTKNSCPADLMDIGLQGSLFEYVFGSIS